MTRQKSSYNEASRKSFKEEFVENYLMNEEVVVFGVDHSEDRKKSEDMRNQIAALFSSHYGQGYDGGQDQDRSRGVDWGHLGDQLRRKCNLK